MAGVSGSGNNMRVLLGGAAAVVLIGVGAFVLREMVAPEVDDSAAVTQPPPAPAVPQTAPPTTTQAPPSGLPQPATREAPPAPDVPAEPLRAEQAAAPDPAPETQITGASDPQAIEDSAPEDPLLAPVITPPVVTVVRIDPKGSALLAGKAPEGSSVLVQLGTDVLATVQTSATGEFAALFTLAPSPEPRALSVVAEMASGETIHAVDMILVAGRVEAVTPPEDAPVAVAQAPQVPSAAIEPTLPPDAAPEPAPAQIAAADPAPPTVVRTDGDTVEILQGAPELVTTIGIDTITYDSTGDVVLSGRGDEASEVRVYLNNRPIKSTDITVDGTWRADLPDVDTGLYTLRIDEVATDGTVVSRLETPFERAAPEVVVAAVTQRASAITVQPGFTLWGIAQTQLGDGTRYVQLFEANRTLIRDPDLIYPGQVFAIPQE